jgi:hypothetical protein
VLLEGGFGRVVHNQAGQVAMDFPRAAADPSLFSRDGQDKIALEGGMFFPELGKSFASRLYCGLEQIVIQSLAKSRIIGRGHFPLFTPRHGTNVGACLKNLQKSEKRFVPSRLT